MMLDMGDLFSWINGIYAKCIKNLSNETISISNIAQNKRIKSYNRKLKTRSGIFLPKLFWPTVRKKCSSYQEKCLQILRLKAENSQDFWGKTRTIFETDFF